MREVDEERERFDPVERALMLKRLSDAVETREDLTRFIAALATSARADRTHWPNAELPVFLDAVAGWLSDMDGYYLNRGEPVPVQPTWRTFAELMLAARIYE